MTSIKLCHKKWKSLLKKNKRKCKRQLFALAQASNVGPIAESNEDLSSEEIDETAERERKLQHLLWLERERLAQEVFAAKKLREEKEKEQKEAEQKKIKEDFERVEARLKDEKDLKEKKQKEILGKISQNKEATNDWHNPLAPEGCSNDIPDENFCGFYRKVGACRFGNKCQRIHQPADFTRTLLFPGMFQNYELEHFFRDEFDTDQTLECEDKDIYEEFVRFYEEVYPEFKSIGKLTYFIVCCNYEAHMRGNVYVEYKTVEEAIKAFQKFNGRWFDKKQLSCSFVKISSWAAAICGQFYNKRCPKGKNCNFIHAFRNPRNKSCDRKRSSRSRRRSRSRPKNGSRSTSRFRSYRKSSSFHRSRPFRSNRNQSKNISPSRSPSISSSRPFTKSRSNSSRRKRKKFKRSKSKSTSCSVRRRVSKNNKRNSSKSASNRKSDVQFQSHWDSEENNLEHDNCRDSSSRRKNKDHSRNTRDADESDVLRNVTIVDMSSKIDSISKLSKSSSRRVSAGSSERANCDTASLDLLSKSNNRASRESSKESNCSNQSSHTVYKDKTSSGSLPELIRNKESRGALVESRLRRSSLLVSNCGKRSKATSSSSSSLVDDSVVGSSGRTELLINSESAMPTDGSVENGRVDVDDVRCDGEKLEADEVSVGDKTTFGSNLRAIVISDTFDDISKAADDLKNTDHADALKLNSKKVSEANLALNTFCINSSKEKQLNEDKYDSKNLINKLTKVFINKEGIFRNEKKL